MEGLLTCAKYALPPNILQYCGPNDNRALFEILKENVADEELKNLLLQFEGAVPYLRLIAQANGIKNEFDSRVVEAYWLGNNLLRKVEIKNIFSHVEKRFKKNMKQKDWSWLLAGSIPEAKPFHGFHVFDIYRRTGLLRSGSVASLLKTVDNCRIGWGRIKTIKDICLVEYTPLEFKEGKLKLGEKTTKKVYLLDTSIKVGDEVSLHWNYICDKITPEQKKNLIYWTKFHLKLTNQTI